MNGAPRLAVQVAASNLHDTTSDGSATKNRHSQRSSARHAAASRRDDIEHHAAGLIERRKQAGNRDGQVHDRALSVNHWRTFVVRVRMKVPLLPAR